MDIITAITKDHEEIRDLVERLAATDADTEYLLAQLRLRLVAHQAASETQVYQLLLHGDPDCAETIGARVEGHRGLDAELDDVERGLGRLEFGDRLTGFGHRVAAELSEEEATVLPLLREVFDREHREAAGRRYQLRSLAELDARTPTTDAPQEPTG